MSGPQRFSEGGSTADAVVLGGYHEAARAIWNDDDVFMPERPDWWAGAACKGHPLDWWFPPQNDRQQVGRKAKAICATCPVVDACLQDALDRNQQDGIFGGMGVRERRTYRRQQLGVARLGMGPRPKQEAS